MPEQPRNPFAPPGDAEAPLELAPDMLRAGAMAKAGRDPFAPPSEGDALELSLEIAKPAKRPPTQTVAPDPPPPARNTMSERAASTSGVFPMPEKPGSGTNLRATGGASGTMRATGGQRVEHKKPREGMSNLLLWGFAGLGALAVIGSAVRFIRGSSREATQAASSGAVEPAAAVEPTVWKPVELGPNVLVTIDVSPRSARLLLDGEPMISNPIQLPRGTKHTIGALADGFEGSLTSLTADKRKTIRIVLRKARR